MLYRVELREAAAKLLSDATDAGPNVFSRRALPLTQDALPAIYLSAPSDTARSTGRNAPEFVRTAQLNVDAMVSEGTPEATQDALDALTEQIELLIMQDVEFQARLSQVSDISTLQEVTSENSAYIGKARVAFSLEYFEEFSPGGTPVTSLDLHMQARGNTDFAEARDTFPLPNLQ
ncbi:hypothetical protein AD953_04765 [Acetobacter malorum]|uniref:Uncharacterized protein n=1 Tax=Acetobacter malorum TaxID=178901 RepID=A0A149VAF1_9PROT|nr:hypothetical protein [Acetobacter malorum]KXV77209.1 hypothetical protein AD953_04765 [Acetobacter malorum]